MKSKSAEVEKTQASSAAHDHSVYASPRDLAAFVHKTLGGTSGIELAAFEQLVNAAYSASLHTAEGREINLDILLRLGAGKWESNPKGGPFHPFGIPRHLDADTLVQLAHGLEADQAGVAAQCENGKISLVGLVEVAPALVGESQFLASLRAIRLIIAAPGDLIFITDDIVLAELRDGSLLTQQSPVLFQGMVRERLRAGANDVLEAVAKSAGERRRQRMPDNFLKKIERARLRALFNLLLEIRSQRRGGSLVILPEEADPAVLNVGFAIAYAGIPNALQEMALAALSPGAVMGRDDKGTKPAQRAVRLARRRLDDAVRFVARLSGVDGITVIDEQFRLLGFGAIALSTDIVAPVKRFADRHTRVLSSYDTSSRGTRHRSVIATCARLPAALGFIVSQDGHIRTVLRRPDDVIVWDRFAEGPSAGA